MHQLALNLSVICVFTAGVIHPAGLVLPRCCWRRSWVSCQGKSKGGFGAATGLLAPSAFLGEEASRSHGSPSPAASIFPVEKSLAEPWQWGFVGSRAAGLQLTCFRASMPVARPCQGARPSSVVPCQSCLPNTVGRLQSCLLPGALWCFVLALHQPFEQQ